MRTFFAASSRVNPASIRAFVARELGDVALLSALLFALSVPLCEFLEVRNRISVPKSIKEKAVEQLLHGFFEILHTWQLAE